ncbi:MAG: M48 family metallopeptidase [Endomicrobiales bacterium]|jgi:STE24 endopeptidase
MMEFYRILVVGLLLFDFVLSVVVESLNIKNISEILPDEFRGFYDEEKYRRSQRYLRENTIFGLISGAITTALMVAVVLTGAFNVLDEYARTFGAGSLLTGLIFCGILLVVYQFIHLPFSLYHTFVIEEKYGFNKTTVTTFILDFIKGIALSVIIGGLILACILWFFENVHSYAWLYSWGAVTIFSLVLTFIAPVVIMPLFNKFTPLAEGDLKQAIERYARQQDFKLKGIFTMDGSRRSSKANAFFTGFGGLKRIVLFDTLIARQTAGELVAILAHEMGHYKKGHIKKMIILSVISSGCMFFLLSLFLNNHDLSLAFGMSHVSIYTSLLFFGFIYSPVSALISIFGHVLSRRYEFEADSYAGSTYGDTEAMVTALKKLTVDNLGNLTPHPLKVFIEYSHPPILARIEALRMSRH